MTRFLIPVLGTALLALSGCDSSNVINCPIPVILADASQMAVFRRGGSEDLSGEAYRVALTDVSTGCSIDKKTKETNSNITLNFRATRAPSADGAHYTVPYFVAVTQGDVIIEKRILSVQFDFAPGATVATFNETPDSFDINVETGQQPIDYELMAGLQMTPAQVAYIKKIGTFTP